MRAPRDYACEPLLATSRRFDVCSSAICVDAMPECFITLPRRLLPMPPPFAADAAIFVISYAAALMLLFATMRLCRHAAPPLRHTLMPLRLFAYAAISPAR